MFQSVKDALITSAENSAKLKNQGQSATILSSLVASSQPKLYLESLNVNPISVTITARTSIPVLNGLDRTPLAFNEVHLTNVLAYPDQLGKDLAANYVADALVRSPLLVMSLNIFGNPAYVDIFDIYYTI